MDASRHAEIPEKPDQKPEKGGETNDDDGRLEEVLRDPGIPSRRGGRRRRRGNSCSSTDSEKVNDKESRPDETTIQHSLGHLLLHSALSTPVRPGPLRPGAKVPPTDGDGEQPKEGDEDDDEDGERDPRSRSRLERRFGGRLMLMDERFMPTPPPSASPLIRCPDSRPMSNANGHHWTFEEQFKQVTTLSFDLTVR